MPEGHPERQALPHHASTERAVRSADDLVAAEKQSGTDRIGEGRYERGAALEAGQRVLLDGEWMQLRTEAVCLLFPFIDGRELTGEVRFPEGDVANASDAEDHAQFCSLGPQLSDFFGIGWQQLLGGEVALFLWDRQLAERSVERLFHRVLKSSRVVRWQRVACGVAPLVHVEAVDVLARDAPLGQKVHGPAVHSHRTDGQDESELFASVSALLDRQGDFVSEHHVEVGETSARHQLKLLMPPLLTNSDVRRIGIDAGIDLGEVPSGREKAFHERTGQRAKQIHRRILCSGVADEIELHSAAIGRNQSSLHRSA